MFDSESGQRFKQELKNLFPLFRYLILQTETHAFCLALACAALIGFYPACLVVLTVLKNVLSWDAAYNVLLNTLADYYPAPTREDFLVDNLKVTLADFGRTTRVTSLLWVLLGAAGVFIPLETGFNRLWQVREDRPYWMNQLVGFALTLACVVLAVLFVSISTALHFLTSFLPIDVVRTGLDYLIMRVTTTCFAVVTIFAFYKFLPNKTISTREVMPAAILAGIMAELVRVIYVLVLPSLNLSATQGPYVVSVSFVLLAYFETFVVLGGAFLASQTERYPWMGFLREPKRSESPPS
jgi:uncharacterized BrkB/YihY/UPF0761 family membrane protein